MANLIITATSVSPVSGATKTSGIAGEAITSGQAVYKKDSDSKYYLADSNHATDENQEPDGIALNSVSANQTLQIQTSGNINIGATVVIGETYFLSDTPGGICPEADLTSGEKVTVLGIGISTTTIKMGIQKSGVEVP